MYYNIDVVDNKLNKIHISIVMLLCGVSDIYYVVAAGYLFQKHHFPFKLHSQGDD